MKKIFIALAAVAAMVGCSKENAQMETVSKDSFKMNASIVLDETRVTVDGEKFTDVKWEQGDNVTLSSAAGASATLAAESAGDTDVRFVGEGSAVADTDTYYAIYPATPITNGVVSFDLTSQLGDDAAVLAAKAEGAKDVAIDMTFKPVNSLLHVAVSGVESLSKAEFVAFDGAMLPQGYTYSFLENAVQTYGEVSAYTIENPSAGGFFFSLPADLDMANGYVVRLTDANGNVCSKAYNGKTFAAATTSRVAIDFATPSVTLGAKTSYSYYAAGDSATANSCANTDIFFVTGKKGESCASSYTGVQDAMISDLGYEVDGTTYAYSDTDSQVSWDKATNTFCMISNPSYSTSWGEKSGIRAFIVVEGKKIYSTNYVWLTGMPYSFKFHQSNNDSIDAAGWKRNGNARIEQELLDLHDGGLAGSGTGWVASPAYYAPQTIETALTLQAKYYVAALRPNSQSATLYVGTTTSNTSTSST